MIEEPYRWLEAVANRREYVDEQLKGGSPVFAASLADGILLLGVGSGQSKVFELFDRQAMAALGHPADIEKIRQAAIDAAHMEAFTRSPEDVSLRRLVSFGLSAQLKTNFEQIFSAPFLVETLFAELGEKPASDLFFRVHFDGSFEIKSGGVCVAASQPDVEKRAGEWLQKQFKPETNRTRAADLLLRAWWLVTEDSWDKPEAEQEDGWRKATAQKTVELAWLERKSAHQSHYRPLSLAEVALSS